MSEFENLLTAASAYRDEFRGRNCALDFGDRAAEFQALRNECGIVDLSNRTQIELAGEESPAFLHNLCTNDTKALTPGTGCEAFITNAQGKIIAHGFMYRTPQGCVFETIPGQGEALVTLFDRYLFREKIELIDRSDDWAELLIAGQGASGVFSQHSIDSDQLLGNLNHTTVDLSGVKCVVRRVDFIGSNCFQLSMPREELASVWRQLVDAGARPCGAVAFEQARILHGTPLYGVDISEDNLPQEVDRNERAISFTKGCYIGQETVARIDALGHVNRTLCGLRVSGGMPEAAAELFAAEDAGQSKPVAKVTSTRESPHTDADAVALAYVRRGHNAPGIKLVAKGLEAEVVDLPMA